MQKAKSESPEIEDRGEEEPSFPGFSVECKPGRRKNSPEKPPSPDEADADAESLDDASPRNGPPSPLARPRTAGLRCSSPAQCYQTKMPCMSPHLRLSPGHSASRRPNLADWAPVTADADYRLMSSPVMLRRQRAAGTRGGVEQRGSSSPQCRSSSPLTGERRGGRRGGTPQPSRAQGSTSSRSPLQTCMQQDSRGVSCPRAACAARSPLRGGNIHPLESDSAGCASCSGKSHSGLVPILLDVLQEDRDNVLKLARGRHLSPLRGRDIATAKGAASAQRCRVGTTDHSGGDVTFKAWGGGMTVDALNLEKFTKHSNLTLKVWGGDVPEDALFTGSALKEAGTPGRVRVKVWGRCVPPDELFDTGTASPKGKEGKSQNGRKMCLEAPKDLWAAAELGEEGGMFSGVS